MCIRAFAEDALNYNVVVVVVIIVRIVIVVIVFIHLVEITIFLDERITDRLDKETF